MGMNRGLPAPARLGCTALPIQVFVVPAHRDALVRMVRRIRSPKASATPRHPGLEPSETEHVSSAARSDPDRLFRPQIGRWQPPSIVLFSLFRARYPPSSPTYKSCLKKNLARPVSPRRDKSTPNLCFVRNFLADRITAGGVCTIGGPYHSAAVAEVVSAVCRRKPVCRSTLRGRIRGETMRLHLRTPYICSIVEEGLAPGTGSATSRCPLWGLEKEGDTVMKTQRTFTSLLVSSLVAFTVIAMAANAYAISWS